MANPQHATSKTAVDSNNHKRDVMRLRVGGLTLQEIGEKVGLTKGRVWQIVKEELAVMARERRASTEELRALSLTRLDALRTALWAKGLKGDEKTIDRLIKIEREVSLLQGLYAPVKAEVTGANGGPIQVADALFSDEDRVAKLTALLEKAKARMKEDGGDEGDAPNNEVIDTAAIPNIATLKAIGAPNNQTKNSNNGESMQTPNDETPLDESPPNAAPAQTAPSQSDSAGNEKQETDTGALPGGG